MHRQRLVPRCFWHVSVRPDNHPGSFFLSHTSCQHTCGTLRRPVVRRLDQTILETQLLQTALLDGVRPVHLRRKVTRQPRIPPDSAVWSGNAGHVAQTRPPHCCVSGWGAELIGAWVPVGMSAPDLCASSHLDSTSISHLAGQLAGSLPCRLPCSFLLLCGNDRRTVHRLG